MSEKYAKAKRKEARESERLKGWKIDITPYEVKVIDIDATGQPKTAGGRPVYTTDEFDVQGSLADILFNRDLQLGAEDSFKAYDLAKKIRAAETHVVLDSVEMDMVRRAYEVLKGVSENMVEFCRRIRDAEEIKLAEVDQ